MRNFQPLEVVGRGSETQPEVVENLNKLTHIRFNPYIANNICSRFQPFYSTVKHEYLKEE